MNIRISVVLAVLLALGVAGTATARGAAPIHDDAVGIPGAPVLQWNCARSGAPSVAEIVRHFGIANAGQAYHWRGVVHRYLRHACQRAQERLGGLPADRVEVRLLAAR